MYHFAGLDVSVKETSICIVDDTGKIVREVKVASEPEGLLAVLKSPAYNLKRIGLEAGPLSQWLYCILAEAGLPVICVETRHMRAVLKAQINKTDRNDARGIAQMMRVGIYRLVHDSFTVRTKVEQQVFQCEFQSVFSQWTNQYFRQSDCDCATCTTAGSSLFSIFSFQNLLLAAVAAFHGCLIARASTVIHPSG
jgi:hypothetical protein